MAVANTTADQILNALPGPAANLCRELLGRYANLPLVVPVTTALTCLSGAVGPSLRLSTGIDAAPVSAGLQVLLGLSPGSLASHAIDHVLAPLRALQRDLFASRGDRNLGPVRRRLERLEAERDRYLCDTPFPEPATVEELNGEIARLRSLVRPIILCEEAPERLCRAFQRSPDETIFLLTTKPGDTKALLQHWCSPVGRPARELAEAAASGQPFTTAFLDDEFKLTLANPLLSGILVGDFVTVREFLTAPGMAAIREATSFMAIDAGGQEVRVNPDYAGPLEHAGAWDGLIRRHFAARHQGIRQIVTLTPAVRDYVVEFVNGLAASRPRQSEAEAAEAQRTLRQALILMLLLHACGPDPSSPVEMRVAHNAALLASWLHGHQTALKQRVGSIDPLDTFVRERLVFQKRARVTLPDVHRACQDYYLQHGLAPPQRLRFESRIAPLLHAHLSVSPSHCLKDTQGKAQRGWVNIAIRSGPSEPVKWLTA